MPAKPGTILGLWNCELSNSLIFKAPERLYCLNEVNHLCLQQNNLNDEHAECIGTCLTNSWHNIRHLNLRKNSITDEGALSLLTGIRKSVYLKELFLDMNRIKTSDTIQALQISLVFYHT
ncbi:hypothetical protein FSP39_002885 [Pinctada imbricata]|uniref:Uncharacterized protein n=1 Tax=Pinctada imbricata TaxID=66713 RepID=A0AA89C6D2_PINIB|nr:hypothetical protein FSP39_002885 [Pinctada imbricata]